MAMMGMQQPPQSSLFYVGINKHEPSSPAAHIRTKRRTGERSLRNGLRYSCASSSGIYMIGDGFHSFPISSDCFMYSGEQLRDVDVLSAFRSYLFFLSSRRSGIVKAESTIRDAGNDDSMRIGQISEKGKQFGLDSSRAFAAIGSPVIRLIPCRRFLRCSRLTYQSSISVSTRPIRSSASPGSMSKISAPSLLETGADHPAVSYGLDGLPGEGVRRPLDLT